MLRAAKKKWIWIATVAALLISMLAIFSLPATAADATMEELRAKYFEHYRFEENAHQKALFNGTAITKIIEVRNLINRGASLAEVQAADAAATSVLTGAIVNRYDYKTQLSKYPDYEEWKTYYKPLESSSNYIEHIRIISEDQWRQLVNDTNADVTAAGDLLFTNKNRITTIHLDAPDGSFDMNNVNMYPVGYNADGFVAHINGHDQVFENINITLNNPTQHVGLISAVNYHRIYQNFGIASGKIEVTGAMASGKYIGGIAGGITTSSVGLAEAGILRKLFNNATIKSYQNDTNGILGYGNTWPIMDGCFNTGRLEVTAKTSEEYNSAVCGLCGYAGNRLRLFNCFANSTYGVNTYSEYHGISYHNGIFTVMVDGDQPVINSYGSGKFVHYTATGAEEQFAALNAASKASTALLSAYKLNQSYVPVDYTTLKANYSANPRNIYGNWQNKHLSMLDTDRIYYTMTEEGEVRFGTAENQIRKVTILDRNDKAIKEFYVNSNTDVDMNYHLGYNYYALVSGAGAFIKKSEDARYKTTLHVGTGDVVVKIAADIRSGDANGSGGVDLMDAMTALRYSVGRVKEAEISRESADVNFDSVVNTEDAVLLVRFWMGDHSKYDANDYPIENQAGWLKVASYNIKSLTYCADPATPHNEYWCYGTSSDYHVEYTSQYQADECAQVLNAAKADIIGFQEVRQTATLTGSFTGSSCYSNLNTLASKMTYGSNWKTSFSYNSRSGSYYYNDSGSGVISKFNLGSNVQKVYYDAQVSDTSEQRIYTRYTISGSQLTAYGFPSNSTLVWYNTHLGGVTREQMAQLGEAMEADYAAGYYVVATADYNHAPANFKDCSYEDYYFDIKSSHFTMANGGKYGNITNGERQQIDNILISDNLEFYFDPATQNALHRVDVDTLDNFTPNHTEPISEAPAATGKSYDSTLEYASDHSLVYAYIRVKNA